jgi:hypothetical protein
VCRLLRFNSMNHMGHDTPDGKVRHQLVFENAVNLYKIPVTLPQERALTSR